MEYSLPDFEKMSTAELRGYIDLPISSVALLRAMDDRAFLRPLTILRDANIFLRDAGLLQQVHHGTSTQLGRLVKQSYVERIPETTTDASRNWLYRRTETGLIILEANNEKIKRIHQLLRNGI